jgi:hypothetical protein
MERYTKSFIGQMEMSNTGEWVKFEVMKALQKKYENEHDKLIEINTVLEDVNSELSEKIGRLEEIKAHLTETSSILGDVNNGYEVALDYANAKLKDADDEIKLKSKCLEIAIDELLLYKFLTCGFAALSLSLTVKFLLF